MPLQLTSLTRMRCWGSYGSCTAVEQYGGGTAVNMCHISAMPVYYVTYMLEEKRMHTWLLVRQVYERRWQRCTRARIPV